MRLYVTVVAAPGLSWDDYECQPQHRSRLLAQLPNNPVELALKIEAGPGSAIVTQLELETPAPTRFWVEGRDLGKLQVGEPPLVDGVVIVATPHDGSVPVRRHRFNQDLVFSVLSGPDSGELKVLRRGAYSIGRVGHNINIADPQLSRHHAQLTVEAARVQLKDCRSANGSFVDQARITTAPVTTDSIMQMGSSRCSLRFSDESKSLPQMHLDPSEPLVISRDAPPQRRGTIMLTALLPVVIGVGLALITGMWIFLAFSAVSAVTMLLPVFSGRGRRAKFKKDLEAARIADRDRRLAATPFLADTIRQTLESAAAVSRMGCPTEREVNEVDQSADTSRWIRLGTAAQPANLRLDPPGKGFVPPVLPAMPVALNLSMVGQFAIAGADDQVSAMIRSLSMQIFQATGHYQRLMFCGPLSAFPLSARFLPGVQLILRAPEAVSVLRDEEGLPPVLFIGQQSGITSKEEDTIRQMTAAGRLNVIWYGDKVFREDMPTLTLSRESAVYRIGHEQLALVPDMVSEPNFDRYCRARARLLAYSPPTGTTIRKMPVKAPLNGIIDANVDGIRNSWDGANADAAQLQAPIGVTPSAPMAIDLQQDGPHLLIAGTTGSGKSELLRTIVLSLAMHHSPSKLNFLFVDFKGGSGLGPLRSLPHTVGMLTDLSAEAVGRAMDSLHAEVRRRELLFAQAEAADLASYRKLRTKGLEELAHLVVVIDEYRMLLEEVPDAMDELLRIATLGRSLGLHLVMATQRPQGAVSADIRANVTTSIALRVQSAMESQDVIDSSVAAGISVKVPGRAYLKRGGESPEQFQSASTSEITPRIGGTSGPATITTLQHSLEAESLVEEIPPDIDSRSDALKGYITAVSAAWYEHGGPPARSPITDPLPERLDEVAPWLGTRANHPEAPDVDKEPILLGLLDLPSVQQQKRLIWAPEEHSHLALLGAPRSGLNSSIRHIVRQLLRRDVRRTHMYILDGDGTLPGLNRDCHVGAYVGADEIRRAVRVIELLAEAHLERLAS
ncbi:FtsK/SpoIIIE domain-containing protein, partial [Arthrobacter sp. H14]|uniref:FtsK/SpoIIIE domain-containing protein n=1 Tax=Arthrobacter sp. H14 TaxID=1312959 RepID=UPI0012DDD5CF